MSFLINSLCAGLCRKIPILVQILLFFLQVTLSQSNNNSKAVTNLQLESEESNLIKPESASIYVEFLPKNVLIEEKQDFNISFTVSGSNEVGLIYLYFCTKGDDILESVSNLTINVQKYYQTFNLLIKALSDGHAILYAKGSPENMTNTAKAFTRIAVHFSKDLDYFSDIVGWTYFVAWSFSFYPQTYLNWKRKSVIGLHFDFLALNVIGFFVYSIFNIGMYWIPEIENEYLERHPFGVNPVQLNDVIFSIHALVACLIQVVQCLIYEKGEQQISKTGRSIIGVLIIIGIVSGILSGVNAIQWLDYLYILSAIKLFITLIKYIPQAYYNYLRKSTSGWSIGNIMLDFTGGSLSILQMVILASNYNDWGSIFGDPTKFGLGVVSICFDVFFIIQHYVLYKNSEMYEVLPDTSFATTSGQSNVSSPESVGSDVIQYGSTQVIISNQNR